MTAPASQTVDELLARTLAAGRTITRAAKTARVSESTVYSRLREPAFQARVFEIRAAALDTTRGRLVRATADACDTLHRLLIGRSEAIQLRAAKTLIELAVKLHDRDIYPGPAYPDEAPRAQTESLSTATPAPENTRPQEPNPIRPEPVDAPRPVTPPPEIAAKPEERPAAPDTVRDPLASPVSVAGCADSAREPRPVDLTPSLLATGESGRPSKTAQDLSKPVKTCHRPAGRPPLNEVNRLSAGLTAALAGLGCE